MTHHGCRDGSYCRAEALEMVAAVDNFRQKAAEAEEFSSIRTERAHPVFEGL
jgi:hypothetical protein